MSYADLSITLGFIGLVGGIIRYELEMYRHGQERREQLDLLRQQNSLIQEIRDCLLTKG